MNRNFSLFRIDYLLTFIYILKEEKNKNFKFILFSTINDNTTKEIDFTKRCIY